MSAVAGGGPAALLRRDRGDHLVGPAGAHFMDATGRVEAQAVLRRVPGPVEGEIDVVGQRGGHRPADADAPSAAAVTVAVSLDLACV